MRFCLLGGLLLVLNAACAGDYPRAGHTATMKLGQHRASGIATILDQRTIRIDGATYDGSAPSAFVWLAASNTFDGFKNGRQIGEKLTAALNNQSITVQLPEGQTLDGFTAVGFWCVDFQVLFTSALFVGPDGGTPPVPAGSGSASDTDGDGFSDAIEIAAGTSSTNAASTPFNGAPAGQPRSLSVGKLWVKLIFARASADSSAIHGELPLEDGVSLAGQSLIFEIGGMTRRFDLDEKGRGGAGSQRITVKPKGKNGQRKFAMKLQDADIQAAFIALGLVNDDVSERTVVIPVTVVFAGALYRSDVLLDYFAKKDRGGLAQ